MCVLWSPGGGMPCHVRGARRRVRGRAQSRDGQAAPAQPCCVLRGALIEREGPQRHRNQNHPERPGEAPQRSQRRPGATAGTWRQSGPHPCSGSVERGHREGKGRGCGGGGREGWGVVGQFNVASGSPHLPPAGIALHEASRHGGIAPSSAPRRTPWCGIEEIPRRGPGKRGRGEERGGGTPLVSTLIAGARCHRAVLPSVNAARALSAPAVHLRRAPASEASQV